MSDEKMQEGVGAQARGMVGRAIEGFLIGAVEAVARAGAKAIESLTTDASKAIAIQQRKVEKVTAEIKNWRESTVGELVDDVPEELRDR